MKWLLLGLVLLPAVLMLATGIGRVDKPETVDELNVNKYLGEWYAIASIVKFFNRSCLWGNKAKYSLRDDGRLNVVNTCYTKEGRKNEVKGVAWVPNESEPGKLKVSFVSLFGVNLFAADYWVLDLGKDYDYAVVGDPELNFGWILSRTKFLRKEKLDKIVDKLENIGYDFDDFKMNPQTPP